jgi:hypothetical protein
MDMHSKQQLTEVVAPRYFVATKKEKGGILTEFCLNTGYDRVYATKKLKHSFWTRPHTTKQPRKKRQSPYILIKALARELWEMADYPCGPRLWGMIPMLLTQGTHWKELPMTAQQQTLLLRVKPATLDRMLAHEPRLRSRRINSQTRAGRGFLSIPYACDERREEVPGYLEIDLVAHGGASSMGNFLYTLNTTDYETGWYEAEAIMGKSQEVVRGALERINQRLPFALKGIDADSGSEFINEEIKNFAESMQITFTRSRPYKKNDNAHIEQKNWTNVRRIIGYLRFDTRKAQDLLNDLYRNELRLYLNFFIASQKLISKQRVGSRIKRKYDKAQSPYQRVLAREDVHPILKEELKKQFATLNVFALKRSIDKKIEKLFTLARKDSVA